MTTTIALIVALTLVVIVTMVLVEMTKQENRDRRSLAQQWEEEQAKGFQRNEGKSKSKQTSTVNSDGDTGALLIDSALSYVDPSSDCSTSSIDCSSVDCGSVSCD